MTVSTGPGAFVLKVNANGDVTEATRIENRGGYCVESDVTDKFLAGDDTGSAWMPMSMTGTKE